MFWKKKLSGGSLDCAVVEHMNKKYNDVFTIKSRDYAGFMSSADSFTMRCTSYPNEIIKVEHSEDGIIWDNYLTYYYHEQHRERMQKFMEEVLGDCVVSSDIDFHTSTIGLECSFEEYICRKYTTLSITVYISNDKIADINQLASELEKKMLAEHIRESEITISVVLSNEIYERYQRDPDYHNVGFPENYLTKQYIFCFNPENGQMYDVYVQSYT